MVSLFRRKKPEASTPSTRRYSVEELAAAFPAAPAQAPPADPLDAVPVPPPAEARD
nr:signal recognition particle-docking protein FtsY [Pseudomonadota bacterium]